MEVNLLVKGSRSIYPALSIEAMYVHDKSTKLYGASNGVMLCKKNCTQYFTLP